VARGSLPVLLGGFRVLRGENRHQFDGGVDGNGLRFLHERRFDLALGFALGRLRCKRQADALPVFELDESPAVLQLLDDPFGLGVGRNREVLVRTLPGLFMVSGEKLHLAVPRHDGGRRDVTNGLFSARNCAMRGASARKLSNSAMPDSKGVILVTWQVPLASCFTRCSQFGPHSSVKVWRWPSEFRLYHRGAGEPVSRATSGCRIAPGLAGAGVGDRCLVEVANLDVIQQVRHAYRSHQVSHAIAIDRHARCEDRL
jgi:hypothetical protein